MQKYLQFVDLAQAIDKNLNSNHYETQLLDAMAKAYFLNGPIPVGDLIRQKHIASMATLHSKIKNLIGKGLLSAKPSKSDGRMKELTLTQPALRRYRQLQKAMLKPNT